MIPGFNTDFKYRGETYHVQTEDNGVSNPVVVTLLYHKGAILASRKTSYRELLGTPSFEQGLATLMKDQHKALMKALLAGEFDKNGAAPEVPGGTGEDPAAAAAAAAAIPVARPAPAAATQHAPAAPAPGRLRVPPAAARPASAPLPVAAAVSATTAAPPPRPATALSLDEAIRNYLQAFAAARAAAAH